MGYSGGRNTVHPYWIGMSGELQAQTIADWNVPAGTLVERCVAETEMTVGNLVIESGERFWLVAVAAVSKNFPNRFFVVVERDSEYQCSCGSEKTVGCIIRQNGRYTPSTKTICDPTATAAIGLVKSYEAEAIAC